MSLRAPSFTTIEGCHCEQEYGHDCCHDDECDCEACEDTPADDEDREHLHQPSKYDAALAKYETHLDDDAVTQAVDAIIESKVADNDNEEVKKLLFSCLDLTSLRTADNDESILRLVERVNAFDDAHPDLPHVAAICTYPTSVTSSASRSKRKGSKWLPCRADSRQPRPSPR